MAIAFDATSHGLYNTNDAATSFNISHTITGTNPVLLVFVNGGEDITDVKWNGTAMTLLTRDDANWNTAVFYLKSPATGTHNITITTVATLYQGGNGTEGWGMSFTGVDQTTPIDTSVANGLAGTGLANDYITNITTATANEMLCDMFCAAKAGGTISADAGQTAEYTGNIKALANYHGGVSYKLAASSGSNSMGWTRGSGTQSDINALVVALNVASGTPPAIATPNNLLLMGV